MNLIVAHLRLTKPNEPDKERTILVPQVPGENQFIAHEGDLYLVHRLTWNLLRYEGGGFHGMEAKITASYFGEDHEGKVVRNSG